MALSYAALKAEIQTDPRGYGYAQYVAGGNDAALAILLNQVRPSIRVKRTDIARQEVLEAIDVRDFITNANNLQAAYFQSVTQSDSIRLVDDNDVDTRMMANMVLAVRDTNGSQTRLRALAARGGSRAEELFGRGILITDADINIALRAT